MNQTLVATLYGKRTYNADDATLLANGNPPLFTVAFDAVDDFEQPEAISCEGSVWIREDGAGYGAGDNRYHRLDPVAVQATPVTTENPK
jgi:hypothetical protein